MVQGIYQSPNESIICLVNQTQETFIIQLIGRIRLKYYKDAFNVTLEAQEMHPYTQMIVNFRDIKLSPDNLRTWFVFKFVKKFYKTKKELKLALVCREASWDKRFLNFWLKLNAIFGSKVQFHFFSDMKEAQNWMYGIEEKEDFTFFEPDNFDTSIEPIQKEKNFETTEEHSPLLFEEPTNEKTEELR